jgi:hypothetical protein
LAAVVAGADDPTELRSSDGGLAAAAVVDRLATKNFPPRSVIL